MIRVTNNKINRKRIYFLFILFVMAFALLIYKLVSIQYIYASKYQSYAEYQHMDQFTVNAKRGKILDRNEIELATSLIEKTVYANPKTGHQRRARGRSAIKNIGYGRWINRTKARQQGVGLCLY